MLVSCQIDLLITLTAPAPLHPQINLRGDSRVMTKPLYANRVQNYSSRLVFIIYVERNIYSIYPDCGQEIRHYTFESYNATIDIHIPNYLHPHCTEITFSHPLVPSLHLSCDHFDITTIRSSLLFFSMHPLPVCFIDNMEFSNTNSLQ